MYSSFFGIYCLRFYIINNGQMDFRKDMFTSNGERDSEKIAEYIRQNPPHIVEVLDFILDENEFETKKIELEHKHEDEMRKLFEEYGMDFNS